MERFAAVSKLSDCEDEPAVVHKRPAVKQGKTQKVRSKKKVMKVQPKRCSKNERPKVKKVAAKTQKKVETGLPKCSKEKKLVLKHYLKAPMPPHGCVSGSVIRHIAIPLKKTAPATVQVVSTCDRVGNKKNGARIFNGTKVFKAWRVFGSTYKCTKSEVSTRGISDLANQIRHWSVYVAEMEKKGAPLGSYLNPLAAEWFSGLPLHWTDPALGKVSPEVLEDKTMGCISLFSGCAGLELGLRGWNRCKRFVQWE